MNCKSKTAGDPERAVNGLLSVAQLLEEPRLARLYTFVLREGEATIDDVVDGLEMPRTTAYSDAGTLVELGVLTRDEEQKTHTYSAIPITLNMNLDGDEYTITPTLIEAFGRSPRDQDLDLLIEKTWAGEACSCAHICNSVCGRQDVGTGRRPRARYAERLRNCRVARVARCRPRHEDG